MSLFLTHNNADVSNTFGYKSADFDKEITRLERKVCRHDVALFTSIALLCITASACSITGFPAILGVVRGWVPLIPLAGAGVTGVACAVIACDPSQDRALEKLDVLKPIFRNP